MTERILLYSENISRLSTARAIELNNGGKDKNKEWLTECGKVLGGECSLQGDDRRKEFDERHDEILMENLTAAWLGLYFLGVPFIHAWEKVRRIAESRGGFPSGACSLKYVGDVYRLARQKMVMRLGPTFNDNDIEKFIQQCKDDSKVFDAYILVLSYSPLALLKEIFSLKDKTSRTPNTLLKLGKCYAMLQMRLYVAAGFPIKYFILQEPLCRRWKELVDGGVGESQEMLNDIAPWLKIVFPHDKKWQTVTLLKRSNKIAGMSTCILGQDVGVFTLDTSQNPMPFSGSILRGSLLSSYQEKLGAMDKEDGEPAGEDRRASNVISLVPDRDGSITEKLASILFNGRSASI